MNADEHINITKFNLLSSLQNIVNRNDEDDTDFVIARYLLIHLREIKKISIYTVAEECFTSRSSVQRFIKTLGFDSFTELKEYADSAISHQTRFISYTDRVNFGEYLKNGIEAMIPDIEKACSAPSFRKLVTRLHEAENIIVLTAEDSSAALPTFQQEFLSVGKLIRIFTSANCDLDLLRRMTKSDLLLVCSVTGNFAIAVNDDIRPLQVYKALLTLNTTTLFENSYDLIHYMGSDAAVNSHSLIASKNVYTIYGVFYFFDLLFHEYFLRYGQ